MAAKNPWHKRGTEELLSTFYALAEKKTGLHRTMVMAFNSCLEDFAKNATPEGCLKNLDRDIVEIILNITPDQFAALYKFFQKNGRIDGKKRLTIWMANQDKWKLRQRNGENSERKEDDTSGEQLGDDRGRTGGQPGDDKGSPLKKKRLRIKKLEEEEEEEREECERGAAAAPPSPESQDPPPTLKTAAQPPQEAPDGAQRTEAESQAPPAAAECAERKKGPRQRGERGPAGDLPDASELAEPGGEGLNGPPDSVIAARLEAIWKQHLPENPCGLHRRGARRKVLERFRLDFNADYVAFVTFCREVAGRPYLTGRRPGKDGKPFLASLEWISHPDHRRSMMENAYGRAEPAEPDSAEPGGKGENAVPPVVPEMLDTAPPELLEDWRRVQSALCRDLGPVNWRCWLRDLRLVSRDAEKLVIEVPTGFIREWIRGNCAGELAEALAGGMGWEGAVVMEVAASSPKKHPPLRLVLAAA